ncbi:hypothetical protein SAMN05216338_10505 [Bradyrhizobium sp. Rc2d]|nr:hypothetical protein SAMN05216338_10505 [Bradyrhizobium sp. Rc2d]
MRQLEFYQFTNTGNSVMRLVAVLGVALSGLKRKLSPEHTHQRAE